MRVRQVHRRPRWIRILLLLVNIPLSLLWLLLWLLGEAEDAKTSRVKQAGDKNE